jgi:hypothetical protein
MTRLPRRCGGLQLHEDKSSSKDTFAHNPYLDKRQSRGRLERRDNVDQLVRISFRSQINEKQDASSRFASLYLVSVSTEVDGSGGEFLQIA